MRRTIQNILKIIPGLWICGILLSLIFIQNPFFIRHVDAAQDGAADLENIYNDVYPYIYIDHMNLVYTGFYTTDEAQQVISYCFIGNIGQHSYMIELGADQVQAMTDDIASGISQASFVGQMRRDNSVFIRAAAKEGSSLSEYMEKYDLCSISIYQYHSDLKKTILYYTLALLMLCLISVSIVIEKNKRKRKVR